MKQPQTTHWFLPSQTLKHQIDSQVLSWLSDEGSLTLRLKNRCPDEFCVDVVGEEWSQPDPAEALLLAIAPNQKVLLRQVHLKCNDQLCVYARSVIPLETLQGKHQQLQHLGNKPLGEYLFANPSLKRSRIEWSKLTMDSSLYKVAMADQPASDQPIWGRRSLFQIDSKPLLVSEFFLPVLFK
ncbi:MAG: chorismate lyase [Gammaproteobacteria bacterium]|nr:chorismate lyase [Gammaproteobacteria bacterium]